MDSEPAGGWLREDGKERVRRERDVGGVELC